MRRNQLSPMRSLIFLAVTWVAGTLLFAAEQTSQPAPAVQAAAATPVASPARAQAAQQRSDAAASQSIAADGESEEAVKTQEAADSPSPPSQSEPAERASAADKGSPRRFVPSEQVRADFDVSFPIDI